MEFFIDLILQILQLVTFLRYQNENDISNTLPTRKNDIVYITKFKTIKKTEGL